MPILRSKNYSINSTCYEDRVQCTISRPVYMYCEVSDWVTTFRAQTHGKCGHDTYA